MSLNMTLRTTEEKVLSIFATFCCLSAASVFLSTVTAAMTEQKRASHSGRERITAVSIYSREHNISPKLTLRMKKFAEMEARDSGMRREALLAQMLPKKLMMDLRFEAHAPTLRNHDFFNKLCTKHERTMVEICSTALNDLTPFSDDVIFLKGDACQQMLFVLKGEFVYTLGGRLQDVPTSIGSRGSQCSSTESLMTKTPSFLKPAMVGPGRWLCEAALWTAWENCGELVTGQDGKLLVLPVDEFIAIMRAHDLARAQAILYARYFVQELNDAPVEHRTDLRFDAVTDLRSSERSDMSDATARLDG